MKDGVCLGTNESGIFSFQSAYAVLQKFTETGELLWEKDFINLPSLEGIFEKFVNDATDEDRYMPLLNYCSGIHSLQNGTAILLNTVEEKPVTILWVSNDGSDVQVIEYPDVEHSFLLRFRIAPEQEAILFADSMEGKVFKADWPVE